MAAKVGADDYATATGAGAADFDGLPREEISAGEIGIDAGDQDLARVTAAAWAALERHNVPPTVFRYAGALTRLERRDDGRVVPVMLTIDRIRHLMARITAWHIARGKRAEPAYPPIAVMRDLLAQADPPVPVLERIVTVPILDAAGAVHTASGYVAAARTVIDLAPGLEIPPVSARPIAAERSAARTVLSEAVADFPFEGAADRAHAFAAMLQTFGRALIDGPTPLYLIHKSTPGTGATLLAHVIGLLAIGEAPPAMTEGRDEDEWRKRLHAKLTSGAAIVLLDNIRRRLDTGQLSSALTADVWEDRALGRSEVVRVPVRCLWMATGNNVALSGEMGRRTVSVRLDAQHERPWQRDGFRHPDLRGWVLAQRGDLIWAALTLWRAWIAEGQPAGQAIKGMFESWAAVMGGLLTVAGVSGFLDNEAELYDKADEESRTWRELVQAWWTPHRDHPVGVADLWPIVQNTTLDLGLGDGSERSQRIRLGKRIGQMRGRHFAGYRIDDAGVAGGSQQWRLTETRR